MVKVRSFATAAFVLSKKAEALLDIEIVGTTPVFLFPEAARPYVSEYICLMATLNDQVAEARAESASAQDGAR